MKILKSPLLGLCFLLFTWGNTLKAQSVPTPAPAQKGSILLENGTIHLGTGTVVEKGAVLIVDGKIEQAGTLRGRVNADQTIDLQGQHVYPGLIAPVSQIGLDEIEAVRATDDTREVGSVNPNARAIVSYNTDSRVTPTLRSNGILLAQVAPKGRGFKGTSSVVQLDAWNWEDAAYELDDAVHLNWPSLRIYDAWWASPVAEQKKRIKESLKRLDQTMQEAKAYQINREGGEGGKKDPRLEALIPVVKGEKPLFIYANSEKEIRSALDFHLRHKVKMVLVGGADSWRMTEELKQFNVPVVLRKVQSLPTREDADIYQPYETAARLQEAGVLYCLAMNDFWNYRNLAYQAGTAVAHGLDKELALQAITLNTAKILGIADRTGSLEVGKDANIVVSEGDLLDMRTSKVTHAFIQGRKIDLGNKQKDLYKKFSEKYETEN